jgi:hypothetical protein
MELHYDIRYAALNLYESITGQLNDCITDRGVAFFIESAVLLD